MTNKKSAFTIIEIAIVLAVMSLLVVGTMAGRSLVRSSKLSTAKSLTVNSPVGEIDGLTIWLETSMKQSFRKEEAIDGGSITVWNNISPQIYYDNNASAPTGNEPKYIKDVLNGLSVVRFESNDYLQGITSGISESMGGSIFLVFKSSKTSSQDIFTFGSLSGSGGTLKRIDVAVNQGNVSGWRFNDGNSIFSNRLNSDQPYITSWVNGDGGTYGEHRQYVNGVAPTQSPSGNVNAVPNLADERYLVGSSSFQGDIAEIILYNREISDLERQDVEKYLSEKYKIDLDS